MFGDMIPWFHEALKWRFLLYSYGEFLDGIFCDQTCSMLENMSYGRIVHLRRMDLWHVTSCRDENSVLAGIGGMRHKRAVFGGLSRQRYEVSA
jgi:hypothetical protein